MYEELIHSDEFNYSAGMENENHYFFISKSNIFPFCEFTSELEKLNDYCYFLYESMDIKLNKLNSEIIRIKEGEDKIIDQDFGDVTNDVLMGLEEFILPDWEWQRKFSLKFSCMALQFSFLEWVLKSVCKYLEEFYKPKYTPRFDKSIDKVSNYITKINSYMKNTIKLDIKEKHILDAGRNCRNNFAHGDWEELILAQDAEISLGDIFKVISSIVYKVEVNLINEELIK